MSKISDNDDNNNNNVCPSVCMFVCGIMSKRLDNRRWCRRTMQ